MKSIQNHLSSRLEFGADVDDFRKPVFRSSVLFPAIINENFSTRLTFLGYWFLKRQITEIAIVITCRNQLGEIIKRDNRIIHTAKSYILDLKELLDDADTSSFLGSIEVEIFSTKDMVYPFPAFVINIFNSDFCTAVHSVGRTYNNIEDQLQAESAIVPEAGFDIRETNDLHGFLSFVNGSSLLEDGQISYIITNSKYEKIFGEINLGKILPYEMIFFEFNKYVDNLDFFLGNNSGTISLKHNFQGFFPRFLVGNLQDSFPSLSITHSYYDCTSCKQESDYWMQNDSRHFDSGILIPLFLLNDFYTDLIIYPIASPSEFTLSIQILQTNGDVISSFPNFIKINSNDQKLLKIDFKELFENNQIDFNKAKSAFITADWNSNKIPTRLKYGLNVGIKNKQSKLPCNICFPSILANPAIETKPGSFHWCPLLNVGNSVFTLSNASTIKNYSRTTNVILTFYRENDSKIIKRNIVIPPFGNYVFELDNEPEIKDFIGTQPGWLTATADVPYLYGFYFDFQSCGFVAGDHVF
jgi:hypothetical protein